MKALLQFLTHKEKVSILIFLGFSLIAALAEMVSVLSLVPFISHLSNPEVLPNSFIYTWFWNTFDFREMGAFSFAMGVVTITALGLSAAFLSFFFWLAFRFIFKMGSSLSTRLFDLYLRQPYSFFLKKNSTELIKNTMIEMNRVIHGVLLPINMILSRGLVVFILICVMVATDPLLALVSLGVLGLAYLLVFTIFKKKLLVSAKIALKYREESLKMATEIFASIKELKLYELTEQSSELFRKTFSRSIKPESHQATIGVLPKYLIEFITFGGIILILLYLIGQSMNFSSIIPTISVFAFSTYKLIPYLQQLYQASVTIRFSLPSLLAVTREMGLLRNHNSRVRFVPNHVQEGTVSIRDVSFSYGADRPIVLEKLNLEIQPKTITGIVGITGSGKTTLIDLILGLLNPLAGEIVVYTQKIGYVPQQIVLWDDTIARNIAFTGPDEALDENLLWKVAKMSQLLDFVQELPEGFLTKVGEKGLRLSGGQRQRIGLARALYREPSLLILDEATSALDQETEKTVLNSILDTQGNKTIIMIAHRLTTLEKCDQIYEVKEGHLERVR